MICPPESGPNCGGRLRKEIRDHLGEIVRGSVEETLNAMLDAEADAAKKKGDWKTVEAKLARVAALKKEKARPCRVKYRPSFCYNLFHDF